MKSFLKEIGVAILHFLERELLWIITIVGAIIALKVIIARIGEVDKPTNFVTKPGVDNVIQIRDDENDEWVDVKVPIGHKAKDVVAAGLSKKGKWTVETKHEKIHTDVFDSE